MAEIAAAGYQDLRDYIEANWKYLELRDETGTPVLRITTTDDRLTWTHNAGAQTLELTGVFLGSDADIPVPQTIASSAIFKASSGGSPFSVETFSSFTFNADADQLTVKHQIQVPQVV
jgi:hypothetical protein